MHVKYSNPNFSKLFSSFLSITSFIFLLAIFSLITGYFAQAATIRIPRDTDDINKLPYKILTAAIARGEQYQPQFPYGNISALPFSTRIQAMRNGELDIISAMTSKELEDEFLAIYIPIYKGLMGMRLAIVNRKDQDIFANVQSLQDLQRFTAGQGTYWADSKILSANNLPLVKEMKYHNMFRMLEAERFTYFPRGAHEPWSEVEQRPELNLVVDSHIMLSYKAPFYFFVSKDNQALAEHLTEQLNAMIKDGSYADLFYQDADVEKAISLGNLKNRVVIELENPLLSHHTPISRSELWYQPANEM